MLERPRIRIPGTAMSKGHHRHQISFPARPPFESWSLTDRQSAAQKAEPYDEPLRDILPIKISSGGDDERSQESRRKRKGKARAVPVSDNAAIEISSGEDNGLGCKRRKKGKERESSPIEISSSSNI
jgi:hypothetical protein